MDRLEIKIERFNPEFDASPSLVDYSVPYEEGITVLQALNYIYDELDSTLAYGLGCRDRKCGLCGVEVDGKPRLACLGKVKGGEAIRPLSKLPLVRDLLVDRAWLLPMLSELDLYIDADPDAKEMTVMNIPPEYKRLTGCNECLSCLAACPAYDFDTSPYAGPFTYVKLAQLFYDPRDKRDRKAQARSLGIDRCLSCKGCYCALGLPIHLMAVKALAEA